MLVCCIQGGPVKREPVKCELVGYTCRGKPVEGEPVGYQEEFVDCWLDHSSFLKKQWSPLCICLGEETYR